jgi:hypothetical protein
MKLFRTDGTILNKEFRQAHPNWRRQLAVFVGVIAAILGGTRLLANWIESRVDSPIAANIKRILAPVAASLDTAQRTGDTAAVSALITPMQKIADDFNSLPPEKQAEIGASPTRYCVLAAANLSAGILDVSRTGRWENKSQYENALNLCR